MEIAAAPRAGAVVAALRGAVGGAVVRHGDCTLGPVDLQTDWADRVAITGANGSGKSTLLAALLGRISLDVGHASLGPGVLVGEVDQARAIFLGEQALLDAFGTKVPELIPADTRTLLAKFGLGAAHVLRPAVTLSPGERTRAALALLQARGVNLLVLDEPTNHLDLPAIGQWSPRCPRTPAHCCWLLMTGACSRPYTSPGDLRSSTVGSPSADPNGERVSALGHVAPGGHRRCSGGWPGGGPRSRLGCRHGDLRRDEVVAGDSRRSTARFKRESAIRSTRAVSITR